MSTESEFLRAIIADPDADAPRLAYAGWLEGSVDAARAEFIRVQCFLAALAEDEREYPPLREREAQLLRVHRDAWERPFRLLFGPPATTGWVRRLLTRSPPTGTVFRRGF